MTQSRVIAQYRESQSFRKCTYTYTFSLKHVSHLQVHKLKVFGVFSGSPQLYLFIQLIILWPLCPWPIVFVKLQTVYGESLSLLPSGSYKTQISFFFLAKSAVQPACGAAYMCSPRQCEDKMLFKSPEDMSAEIDHSAMYPCSILAISGG